MSAAAPSAGVFPIAPTPFTARFDLDLDGQRRVLDCMVDQEVDGICILANYSEQFALGLVVLSDSMKQWYGYVILKRPFSSSEVIATAGCGSAGRVRTAIHRHEERGFKLPHGGGCC